MSVEVSRRNSLKLAWGGYLTEADIAAITACLRNMEATAPVMAAPQVHEFVNG